MADLPISIRAARLSDDSELTLIVRTWFGGLRETVRWMPRDDFEPIMKRVVYRAVRRYPCWVACCPDHSQQVYGWICADPGQSLLHYVFIKGRFRGFGLSTRLVAEVVAESGRKLTATTWTPSLDRLRKSASDLLDGYRPDRFRPFTREDHR